MEYITPFTVLAIIFTLHSNGVRSAFVQGYADKDAPIETYSHNSPMNYIPEEFQGGHRPQAAQSEYMLPEEMKTYNELPEIIIPENHHRRRGRRCKDRRDAGYCYYVVLHGRCEEKKSRRRCRKSCGACKDRRECKDAMRNCMYASDYTCSLSWFAGGCRMSCKLCGTRTTTQPTTTTTTTTTTAEPGQECRDTRSNCEYANKYTCHTHFWIRWGCKKTCGVCIPEQTTTTVPMLTSTTTIATPEPSQTSTTRTTTHVPSQTSTTTIATRPTTTTTIATRPTTKSKATSEPQPGTLEPEIMSTTEKVIETTTVAHKTTGATTEAVFMTTTTSRGTDITSEETPEPLLCVDQDEKNCHIWESLGLCYNPKFMEDTIEICPFSCKACTPDDFMS